LAHVTDARGGLPPQRPVIQLRLTCQYFQQAGLAAAIAPDEADTFALIELKIHMIQQGDVTKGQRRFIQRDVRHLTFLFLQTH
jgi:hypothetical protein